ncbi:telomere repeats-binding bouquet formation protein 1 [Pogona vitticeps]
MQSGREWKIQCDVKTDLNLLLECLKYQMDNPASQKESLVTIYSVCQQNSDASDYFREIGGLLFVHNLAKSSLHSMVKEAALFTLGGLAENNVFCQQMLCTSGLFEDLYIFLTDQNSSVKLKRLSVYVLLVLVSNNKSGQTSVRKSGCLDVLLQLFRTILSVSEVNLLDQNINHYHLWSSVCSTLCACVNNPQNEDNQKICTLVFPHAKDWLQNCVKSQIIRPICSFIMLTVANNSRIQQFFVSLGGLAVLDNLLDKLIPKSFENCSNTKLAVIVTKTLDACIADNPVVGVSLPKYNIVPKLLTLLSHNILDSGDRFSLILTLGHCTDNCEDNQYTLVKNNGLPVMIQALTESQDEELCKAAIFVLQNCKPTMEKLSLKLAEHSIIEDDVGNLEVSLQNKERNLEDYRNEAKEIWYKIKSLENEHQKEKMRRKAFNNDNAQEAILQNTSVHLKANASKQLSNNGVACTKTEANSSSPQLIITECIKGSSKNELLKPANRNPIDASVSQNEHNNCFHSKSSIAKRNEVHFTNKSVICESSKSEIQARTIAPAQLQEVLKDKMYMVNTSRICKKKHYCSTCEPAKQSDVTNKNMTEQVQNTELLCSSIVPTSHWIFTSKDPKIPERRCSGCEAVGLSLNSQNFIKILQSCQYLCEQHKIILEIERKYKMQLKRALSSNTSLDYKDDLQTKQNMYSEKQSSEQKQSFKDQDVNEKHTYSFEDENSESCVSEVPAIVFKKQQRRTRKDFTAEEINYLLDGIKKMGHHWNSILWAYPFQKGRTNVDLAKKYFKLKKNENKII